METTKLKRTETNSLKHSIIADDVKGNTMYINIRLNDECHNGHQDFAITAMIYEKGKPKTDKYFISGGACHDKIIATRPDLKLFVDLHLSDYKGIPMYAIQNGRYHINNMNKSEFCEYYRVSSVQYDSLCKSKGESEYAANLGKLGILTHWEEQANKAISLLEEWTGKKFKVDSVRTNLD